MSLSIACREMLEALTKFCAEESNGISHVNFNAYKRAEHIEINSIRWDPETGPGGPLILEIEFHVFSHGDIDVEDKFIKEVRELGNSGSDRA